MNQADRKKQADVKAILSEALIKLGHAAGGDVGRARKVVGSNPCGINRIFH